MDFYNQEYGQNIPIKRSVAAKMVSANKRDEFKKNYEVQFNVFLPPIFKIDLEEFGQENFNVGIATSLTEFKLKDMHKLSIMPLKNNGYLVYGKVEFPIDVLRFEYKYLLSFNEKISKKSYIMEFLGKDKNREFRNYQKRIKSVISVYDGIMLPPDKESESIFKSLKHWGKKIFGGIYFDESLYEIHKDETIKAMFHEIKTNNETKFKTLDSTFCYFNEVIWGLINKYQYNVGLF